MVAAMRQVRPLATTRLTGNYGREILRAISTFQPLQLAPALVRLARQRPACGQHFPSEINAVLTLEAVERRWFLAGAASE